MNTGFDPVAQDFLNVALPKGRLGERVYAMLAQDRKSVV